jgi:hypothetical protein
LTSLSRQQASACHEGQLYELSEAILSNDYTNIRLIKVDAKPESEYSKKRISLETSKQQKKYLGRKISLPIPLSDVPETLVQ